MLLSSFLLVLEEEMTLMVCVINLLLHLSLRSGHSWWEQTKLGHSSFSKLVLQLS